MDRWLAEQRAGFEEMAAQGSSARALLGRLGAKEGNRFADRSRYLLIQEFRLYAMRNPEPCLALEHGVAALAHIDLDIGHDEFVRLLVALAKALGPSKE